MFIEITIKDPRHVFIASLLRKHKSEMGPARAMTIAKGEYPFNISNTWNYKYYCSLFSIHNIDYSVVFSDEAKKEIHQDLLKKEQEGEDKNKWLKACQWRDSLPPDQREHLDILTRPSYPTA
jgi:hypothetical protein